MEVNKPNTVEEWVKWDPVGMPKGDYIVTDFVQNAEGVKIILDDEENVIQIVFDGIPSIIRISVEGLRMRTCREVLERYQDNLFFRNCFLFKIENSQLSKWAEEESCGFYKAEQFKHFCIVTTEEVIDIVATFEPTIKVTDYQKPTQ